MITRQTNKAKAVESDGDEGQAGDDKEFSAQTQHATSSLQPIQTALERIANNTETRPDRISFLDFEQLKAPRLKKDYEFPVLHDFLPFQTLYLSIWPQFEHRPAMMNGESWHCVLDGTEKVRMISPVFNQNLYQNVYEDLPPTELPEDISLFKVKAEKFPLLEEVKEYILEAQLEKGDCVYVPALWWFQFQTQSEESTILSFEYQSSSKFVDILFKAINEGHHKD